MSFYRRAILVIVLFSAAAINTVFVLADSRAGASTQLSPHTFFLVDNICEGHLKNKLSRCKSNDFHKSDFYINHKGASLQFLW